MWFKVDDELADSEKVFELQEELEEMEFLASLGLWLLAGAESARRGMGGEVPTYIKRLVSREAIENLSAHLIGCGLWDECPESKMGAWFHDWDDYNEPLEVAKAKKLSRSQRAKLAANARWEREKQKVSTLVDAKRDAGHKPGIATAMLEQCCGNAPEPEPEPEPVKLGSKEPCSKLGADAPVFNLVEPQADSASLVFNYWKSVMSKTNATKFNAKRKRLIKERLKEGYSVGDIKRAIDGCAADPFSMGENDRGKPFNDIALICRDGEKLESFWEKQNEGQKWKDIGDWK